MPALPRRSLSPVFPRGVGTATRRLQNNWLVLAVFIYNFHLSVTELRRIMCLMRRNYLISCFQLFFLDMSLRLYLPIFSQMLSAIVKEREFPCFWFHFVLQSQ